MQLIEYDHFDKQWVPRLLQHRPELAKRCAFHRRCQSQRYIPLQFERSEKQHRIERQRRCLNPQCTIKRRENIVFSSAMVMTITLSVTAWTITSF